MGLVIGEALSLIPSSLGGGLHTRPRAGGEGLLGNPLSQPEPPPRGSLLKGYQYQISSELLLTSSFTNLFNPSPSLPLIFPYLWLL